MCSPLQRAIGFVASYPHNPMPCMIGECAVIEYQQRKQLKEQRQEQQQQCEQQKQNQKQQKQPEVGTRDADGTGGAAACTAAVPLEQLIAADVQQHLQQRSDMMLQQMHAWGLD
uniref:Uncharacterized protein n=1 Tax=Tetradesmus obliquus TaxID=3088 RepID=A0A383WHD3_TETOB